MLIKYVYEVAHVSAFAVKGNPKLSRRIPEFATRQAAPGLPWTPLISGHLPALSHCHLFHSGPAPRRQQHHLSPRQKSERTHLENLLLCTFSRSTFTSQRAETGNQPLARSGPCCRSTSLMSHPGLISQIRPKCDFFFLIRR